MSILIKGIQMPTSCGKCFVGNREICVNGCPLVPVPPHGDLIERNETIKALWKALYEYEDKTEKQFVESSELDVADWILHSIFVQNMSDIDRQTILQMPTIIPAEEGE